MLLRLGAAFLLLTSATAVELPADSFQFRSEGSTTIATDPGKPWIADGGIKAVYQGIKLMGDRMSLLQTVIAGTQVSAPAEAQISAGPGGPTPTTVVLDTRGATLPTIGFKGLLTPTAVQINRKPQDFDRPKAVQWLVQLPETGAFAGQLRLGEEWAPFQGWAQQSELTLEGTLMGGRVTDVRVIRIKLMSRPAAGDVPQRNAELNRLKPEVVLTAPDAPLSPDQVAGHVDASSVLIDFDAAGQPSIRFTGRNNVWGDPRLFNAGSLVPSQP